MRLKIYTKSGNVYETNKSFNSIRDFIRLNGVQDTYLYGITTRNAQAEGHRTIIPFATIESIMEFEDDE